MVEVTQADREAAAEALFLPNHGSIELANCVYLIKTGQHDGHRLVQAFAKHRIAERERNAGIAERYNFGPEKTERDNARNATSQMIAQAIRKQSNGA